MNLKRTTLLLLSLLLLSAAGCDTKKETTTTDTKPNAETAEKVEDKPAESQPLPEAEAEEGTWVKAAKYGVKFRVPTDWKVKEAEEAVSATSPEDAITIILVGTGSETVFEAAMSSISSEIKLSELKSEKSSMAVINGLAGFHGTGTAVLELESGKQEIQFIGYALRVDADNAVAVMIFAEAEMYEARKEELEGIVKTIQKG